MLIKINKNTYGFWPDGYVGAPIGSFDLFFNQVNPHKPVELWSFGIAEVENFRKGYGSQMLKEAIALVGDRDIKLYVQKNNPVAIHMYQKAGFKFDNFNPNLSILSMTRHHENVKERIR